jgi:putative NADH-flavin reductase
MNITIIGAGAGIGYATLMQALEKGYQVTVLSTSIAHLPDHPGLIKVKGTATSADDLRKVMAGADAVIVTVGTRNKKPNTLFSDTARALVSAGETLGLKAPVLIITGFGAGASSGFLGFFMRTVIRLFLKHQYRNKSLMEEIIGASSLNWEIVRPGMLTSGPLTGKYRVLPELYKGIRVGKISRADVADFLLGEAENPVRLKQYPALSY